MERHYVNPLVQLGVPLNDIIGFSLEYNQSGKCPATMAKAYLGNALKALDSIGVTTLYVADSAYFKFLTKERKSEGHLGYIKPCAIKGYEHMNVILGLNYGVLFHDPSKQTKVDLSLETVANHLSGNHIDPGTGIIHSESYPETTQGIADALADLHQYVELTCDIEAFALEFHKAGIATIGFAWDQHNGISFPVDYCKIEHAPLSFGSPILGVQQHNNEVKMLLVEFFISYQGKITYHNGSYDIKVLIFELFMMKDLLNQRGMLRGIDIMTRSIDDTKLITYLATNSCAGNKLSLKDAAHEFAGNYAQANVNDVRLIPQPELLRYNLVDCLSTWYVKNKHYPTMTADDQKSVYDTIFIPSVKIILQMELTGMPIDMFEVHKADTELRFIRQTHRSFIENSPLIKSFEKDLQEQECIIKNLLLKVKVKPLSDFSHIRFNPSSGTQLQKLIYEKMGYDVIDTTDSGAPATGGKTIKKMLAQSKSQTHTDIFEALIGLADVGIIITTFISAFLTKSILKEDGHWYLHGNFNIGGTVSGRLSSSGPNLQNIPSSSKYAKHIKRCFKAPEGWLFVGADFASLEDRISALTTKDPNKLKVYTDGYDGHCLRAFSYYGELMPDIVNTVDSINSIADHYPVYRQDSKAPTFALTYQGTWHTLVNNIGLSKDAAMEIENKYHELYQVSDQWVQSQLVEASSTGYVTCAFGLRVRTPVLKQTLLNKDSTPYEAGAEGRTAGNALGQSYGMLNNRSGIEFQERVLSSAYALKIRPCAHIHDAQYFMIKNDLGTIKWFNDNLTETMKWQDLPDIKHDDVKLGGDVEIFYPDWSKKFSLPNGISIQEIHDICSK